MRMRQEILDKLINKMIKHIKPNGVSELIYTLEPTDDTGEEYYMMVTYVVPDDSEFLPKFNMRNSDFNRKSWNTEITKTIKDYFDIRVIISNSSIQSESYYKRQKQY
jgi:hypothetical protein